MPFSDWNRSLRIRPLKSVLLVPNLFKCCSGTQDASFFGAAASWLQAHSRGANRHHLTNQQILAARDMESQASKLWWAIRAAYEIVEEEDISIPEPRTHGMDWVRDGVRMPR